MSDRNRSHASAWPAPQVVDVLRQLPNCDELSEAVDFDSLGPMEIDTLGRVLR